jgi:hypothetical protein
MKPRALPWAGMWSTFGALIAGCDMGVAGGGGFYAVDVRDAAVDRGDGLSGGFTEGRMRLCFWREHAGDGH